MNNCQNNEKIYKKALKKICNDEKCQQKNFTIIGPTGPRGEADTLTIRNKITSAPDSEAKVIDNGTGTSHILDFVIPQGQIGPTGPSGFNFSRTAYIVTFNDGKSANGIKIESKKRIPIDRMELDVSNLTTLDSTNKTIKFNETGYYKITFTISAYPAVNDIEFDPTKDIVSVGFRQINTDNAYIGVSQFVYNAEPVQLLGQGIIAVIDKEITYELINLGKYPIYLLTPDIANIATTSYFSNPLVTIVIEYLGRQGA